MSAAARPAVHENRSFLRSRLGSLLAVMPLSVWTVAHLWNNLSAFQGAAAWQADVTEYRHPLAFFASGVIALLPLVLHTIWGIGRILSAQPNNVKYTFFSNIKYAVQRLSAIGVMFFLGAHIWLALLQPRIMTGRAEAFADIAHAMHHRPPHTQLHNAAMPPALRSRASAPRKPGSPSRAARASAPRSSCPTPRPLRHRAR